MVSPKKKAAGRNRKKNALQLRRYEKIRSFLKDFDSGVEGRSKEMEKMLKDILISVDAHCNLMIVKIPLAVRQMTYVDYVAAGGSVQAVAEAEQNRIAAVGLEVDAIETEIIQDAVKLRTAKKSKRSKCDKTLSENENIPPSTNTSRKGRGATFTGKKRHPSVSTSVKGIKKTKLFTPSNRVDTKGDLWRPTPLKTPMFDSGVLKTPGVRVPRHKEQVFTCSVNGSPLSESTEVTINLPVGDCQNVQLTASKIKAADLHQMDKQTLESIKLLSSQLNAVLKGKE
ncbi:borealin [Callorhinchus milii]|uniref:Borealin n=1 Tax=Callorhinchus milii TaxID=7868 RepID=V9KYM2_CALMI|nr:borealin [Callorhinchus milii]